MRSDGEIFMTIADRIRFCKEWDAARKMVLKGLRKGGRGVRRDSSGKRF